jgi:prepilin-type N-terminal cleavage/methylation domain-containing protein
MTKNLPEQQSPGQNGRAAGFSLIELMVAMVVFLIVSSASFTLFSRHETLLSQEQGIAGLNIGLRNALAQLQLDVVNAGNGQIMGANVPAWPVGVTIVNNTGTGCNPSATSPSTYVASCFDQLNVVNVDPNTPAMHPQTSTGGCINTNTGTTLYGGFSGDINPSTGSAYTTTQISALAGNFQSGDQILFVSMNTSGTGGKGYPYTTALLTANGAYSSLLGGSIQLTFSSTGAGGTNTTANDPISMTVNAPATDLTSSFCSTDWVLRLLPIEYSVSVATPTDPQLMRQVGHNGTPQVVMDQVIGMKVGAAWWDNNTSTFAYDYLASDYGSDFTLVRAVRVTLIGRTTPSTDPLYTYKNPFDQGHYQIRGSSIIVNPRNLTMNND